MPQAPIGQGIRADVRGRRESSVRYLPATLGANDDKTMLPLTPQAANTMLVVDSSHSTTKVPRKKITPITPKATDEITKAAVAKGPWRPRSLTTLNRVAHVVPSRSGSAEPNAEVRFGALVELGVVARYQVIGADSNDLMRSMGK